jgi:hypothetical protein
MPPVTSELTSELTNGSTPSDSSPLETAKLSPTLVAVLKTREPNEALAKEPKRVCERNEPTLPSTWNRLLAANLTPR